MAGPAMTVDQLAAEASAAKGVRTERPSATSPQSAAPTTKDSGKPDSGKPDSGEPDSGEPGSREPSAQATDTVTDRNTACDGATNVGAAIERQVARSGRWRYRGAGPAIDLAASTDHRDDQPASVRLLATAWRNACGWLASAGVHCAVLLALGWLTIHSFEAAVPEIEVTVLPPTDGAELPHVQLVSASSSPSGGSSRAAQVFSAAVLDPDGLAGATPELAAVDGFRAPRGGPAGDVRALLADPGVGLKVHSPGPGGAEFFGVKAAGSRFAFVVDCSKSMAGTRWRNACKELMASVERLGPDQSFYVIFFDGESHRMFQPGPPELELMAATGENFDRLRRWVATVQLGFFTRPCKSVQFALKLQPDAIFLLTDGEFTDPTAHYLRRHNKVEENGRLKLPAVVVHTIGFHSRDGEKLLQRIANENGGHYRYVGP